MDENNRKNAALLPSRKAKATSIVLGTSISEESELFTSRKGRTSRKNHNSLPADLAYSFDEADITSELSFCVTEEDDNASCMSPMSRISAFRKELDLLKAGCVSTQYNSPSPDFMLMENLNTSLRPSPLPVDEPFRILSSDSNHVVLPMEEFSIHVPPVLEHVDVIKKIETQFSITDLDMFSGDTFIDSEKLQTLDTTTCIPSVDHLHVDASGSLKGMIRQDSLEYDHLEPGLEDASIIRPTSNNYSVTVQFHELKDTIDCNKPDDATRKLSYSTSLHGECVMDDVKIIKQNIDTTTNQSLAYIPSSSSRCPLKDFGITVSSSIPARLNLLHIKNATTAPSHSLYGINNPIPDEYKCHCPVCCACGSSQRLLVDVVGNGHKLSSVSQKYHDETVSNASLSSCPQEKYSNKVKERLTPSIAAVSQGVSKRIDRVSSVKENRFGSSVEISHSNSVIEDELEISGNQTWCEPDSQSIFSIQSLMSCQSGLTYNSSNSYCSFNQPFNRGVEGSLFKDRIELISQWFSEFNDQQRNSMLLKLLTLSNCSQMHLLSVEMEPILHQSCPHNCQDILSWLPPIIAFKITGFLDPVSLCRAGQVSRAWHTMANDPLLWKRLTLSGNWQMSFGGHSKQLDIFTSQEGEIQWKLMFAERFRLRRNWLKGYCTVRTFEGHSQGISCVQFDDTRIVSGSWDKTIKVWNRRTNTTWAALTLTGHSGTVRCLHLHGNRLVSGSSDRTIKVWDLATNNISWIGAACKATMVGHMHTVRCLKADDSKVVSGSYDHTLKIWDIKTGTCTKTLRGHKDAVLCLQFDNEKVISGSKDTTIKVWEFSNGQCRHTLHGHEGAVSCLQFDDDRIISGALDRLIKIWNLSTGQCVRTIDWIKSEGHTGVVRNLQADNWKLVSAADDKTLKVWSVQSGERLLTLRSHSDGVTCLQFNDQVIVSGSYDKTVKLWDFSVC